MLEAYKKKYHTNNFQFILADDSGCVLETDNSIIPLQESNQLQTVHPFFEILTSLFQIENECFEFFCINLDLERKIIVDITIHSLNDGINFIVIEDLTHLYTNNQLTAQTRNESVINSQILELKNEYLLEKETFKNNFLANFSHQIRNPLTASIVFSDLLINSNLNSEQKNYLNIIQSANKDLKNRIDDILDISKIESGKLRLVEKVFNLKKLLNDIIITYKILAIKKGLNLIFRFDDTLPEFIKGDQYRLKQIINNLLDNAITQTHKGKITLKIDLNYIRAKKANVRIEVCDTGLGIEPQYLESIFERFTRIETPIQKEKSIGLGLAIVKHLVTEMQGKIKVESEFNKGSKFICNLNLKLSDYNQNLKKELLHDQLPNSNKKYNILLAEDSELIQLTILKLLALTGNFYINIISKGEELASNIINKNVDLILMANTMQDFSAIELTTTVRNLSKDYKKIPIIVLSTQGFKEDIKSFKKAGVNDVITKPFDQKILLDKIYKVIK